ncbi:dienelactone hydrolase family protein [Pediococcus inopinatus]|uniref:Dienelactone hydrolase family protein n=1 Tax=Pediococcus inopinatus TaxID=114090 RepID=A0ABZ0Q1T0_9LACO|nr:dienelactone hydrolase family protein [Pediococcus inopinatus]WPC19117.1 dienelactone hydrolase family protein [Pediococcus inopinatus]WPC20905.1 dienelactone hydrolase family protein [Pediococcus inopinatus]
MANEQAHVFFKSGDPAVAPILMLHGTGGDEEDLSKIASYLSPSSPQLGIRGHLIENGQTRYFNHTEDGGFDLESLDSETDWLLEAIDTYSEQYHLNQEKMIVVGYSNGANVAAYAWLAKHPLFKKSVLFHPMVLTQVTTLPDLSNVSLWASHGAQDPIVSKTNFDELMQTLDTAHADISIFEHEQSHNINEPELVSAKAWVTAHLN